MNRRGSTLLELVFAMAVLGLFFFAVISIYPTMMYSVRQSEHRLAATSYAQELLDRFSAGPFKDLDPGVYTTAAPGALAAYVTDRTLDDTTVLQPEVSIAEGPTVTNRNKLRLVTVNIRWAERGKVILASRHRRIAKLAR